MNNMLFKSIVFTIILLTASCASLHKRKTSLLKDRFTTGQYTLTTNWDTDRKGDISALANHYIDCYSGRYGAVSGFTLQKGDYQIRYQYKCQSISYIDWGSCSTMTTSEASNDDGTVQALGSQGVQCNGNSVLTAFGLKTVGNRIQYTYTCCPASGGSCGSSSTSSKNVGGQRVFALQDYNIDLSAGYVLTGFQLRISGENGYYSFNYCSTNQPVTTRSTNWNSAGGGNIFYLDRQYLDCQSGQAGAISRFMMLRSGDLISYFYQCTQAKSINWGGCQSYSNPWTGTNSNAKKSLVYLDRQNVQCGYGSVLTQFGLQSGGLNVRYNYVCCPAEVFGYTTQTNTPNSFGDGNIFYLDRQNVEAYSGAVISGFQLQGSGNYRIDSSWIR